MKVAVIFESTAWDDYLYWQRHDQKLLSRINELLKDISRNPFVGIGKPEPLRGNLTGYWSRRINQQHRLVNKFEAGTITVIQCRFHYGA